MPIKLFNFKNFSSLTTYLLTLVFLFIFTSISYATGQQTLNGNFSVIWGDSFENQQAPVERYFLLSDDNSTQELIIEPEIIENAGGLIQLNGRRVIVTTDVSAMDSIPQNNLATSALVIESLEIEEIPEAMDQGLQMPLASQAISGSQPWVTIMCKFQGITAEPKDLNYFENMYSSSYPGLDHYWRESSYNTVNIVGSDAHGWYDLPQPHSYYVYDGKLDFDRITNDCTAAADADVYFPNFVGINMMFNSDLDGFAWGGGRGITIDGQTKGYRVTWEPPWGYTDITVMAHEMGHGFGMPHSSGNYGQTYDNVWDVMSNAWANCNAARHPTYGCLGQQAIGFQRQLTGWITPEKTFTFSGVQQTITLERLTQPLSANYLLAKIPIGGSARHYYTVESRKKVGYDTKLISDAVIIHEVDLSRSRPAYVIDIDGNGNTGDSGAIWTTGETFTDPTNDICVKILGSTATTNTIKIGCHAPPPPPPPGPAKPTVVPSNFLLL